MTAILDSEGEPMLAGLRAGASIVTPNEREAEELVGQEFADRDDLVHGLGELVRLGAGEAAITRPDGCVAVVGAGAERRVVEVRTQLAGAGLDGRLRRRLPRRLRRRAATTAASRRTASPTGSPAAPSRPSTSAPAPSIAARVERLLGEVEVRDLEVHAEV